MKDIYKIIILCFVLLFVYLSIELTRMITHKEQSYITLDCWNKTNNYGMIKNETYCKDCIDGVSPNHEMCPDFEERCMIYETIQVCRECLKSSCEEEIVKSVKWFAVVEFESNTLYGQSFHDNYEKCMDEYCSDETIEKALTNPNFLWCECYKEEVEETKLSCTKCRNSITHDEMSCD